MALEGTVKNGVIVLDAHQPLDEGARVEVVLKEAPTFADEPTLTGLLELAGTVDDLPPDMARDHDHYLHGAPKR